MRPPVKAAATGYVARAKRCSSASCYAYVLMVHTGNISTVYGHLSSISVSDDQFVNRGDIIGYSGGTAGTVNIVTRSPLDFKDQYTGEASIGAAYSDLADKAGPQLNALVAWKSDDDTIGVMVQGFREDRYLRRVRS